MPTHATGGRCLSSSAVTTRESAIGRVWIFFPVLGHHCYLVCWPEWSKIILQFTEYYLKLFCLVLQLTSQQPKIILKDTISSHWFCTDANVVVWHFAYSCFLLHFPSYTEVEQHIFKKMWGFFLLFVCLLSCRPLFTFIPYSGGDRLCKCLLANITFWPKSGLLL